MAHDGQDMTMATPVILPDLLQTTKAAIEPVEKILDIAREKLRDLVSENGRVSNALIEQNQTASHGLAWVATYVESLRQMQGWAERQSAEGKFGEMEQLLLQISFGEYLWQLYGGIPMNQGEILRLQDIGLSQDDMRSMMDPAVMTLTQGGNTQAARSRLVELMQEQAGATMFGASGLDEELEMIRTEKGMGQDIYCEISPHHLLLNETICKKAGNFAKVNPPLRTQDDNEALWEGIMDYTVDTIGSDHAPHHIKEKKCAYSSALSGFPGLETTVPLLVNCVNEGKLSKGRMIDMLNRKAAYIFGLKGYGAITEGNKANLSIINPKLKETISSMRNMSKAKYSPFDGYKTKGQVVYTVINGQLFKSDERRIKA